MARGLWHNKSHQQKYNKFTWRHRHLNDKVDNLVQYTSYATIANAQTIRISQSLTFFASKNYKRHNICSFLYTNEKYSKLPQSHSSREVGRPLTTKPKTTTAKNNKFMPYVARNIWLTIKMHKYHKLQGFCTNARSWLIQGVPYKPLTSNGKRGEGEESSTQCR